MSAPTDTGFAPTNVIGSTSKLSLHGRLRWGGNNSPAALTVLASANTCFAPANVVGGVFELRVHFRVRGGWDDGSVALTALVLMLMLVLVLVLVATRVAVVVVFDLGFVVSEENIDADVLLSLVPPRGESFGCCLFRGCICDFLDVLV